VLFLFNIIVMITNIKLIKIKNMRVKNSLTKTLYTLICANLKIKYCELNL